MSIPWDATGSSLAESSHLEVWLLRDDLVSDLEISWLSEEERRRGDRYRSPSKCRQFLFSRCVGREIFAARLGVAPSEIRWSTSGPPILNVAGRPPEFSVSVSHSGPIVAVAMSPMSLSIGVDIEISAPLQVAALSAVALTDTEQESLRQVPDESREAVLRQLWTIKEAVLKSLGTSELPDLQSVQVSWDVAQPDWLAALGASRIQLLGDDVNSRIAIGCFHSILEPEGAIWGTISVCNDSQTAASHSNSRVCLCPATESLPENFRNVPRWNMKNGVLHSRLEATI